ncbi:MAG: flagellar filament capping protein FliD [Methylobacter sp.]|nr:flagellar filament capping protein FliD [Methylobacter sp.]
MASITSTGLGSGLDIKNLVSSLVSAEQTPASKKLDKQEALLTTQFSSYGSLKSAMSTFQSSLSALRNLSTFQKLTATSSDTAIVTASAFSNADPASYNLEVKQLAKSQALATPALPSATSTVGTGTLTIKFGTTIYDPVTDVYTSFTQDGNQGTLTLNVDATNNTLAGLSEAINKAKAGVTAVVVTDTSGSRLVLNSTETGANSSMEISVTDDDGDNADTSGLSALAFNKAATNMTQAQAAQDAKLAINGLDILSSSNTVNAAIKGLSFTLQQAQPGKIITVSVSQSNDDIAKAIDNFVKGYNDLVKIVNPLTGFDKSTQKAGLLQSDATLRGAMAQLRSELGNMVSGLNGSATSLADIGISTQKDGTLTLSNARLNSQLASNRSGVAGVFAVLGRPSNSNVSFAASTIDTKAGQYAIDITQIAAQGVLNGTAPTSLTVAAGEDTFAIKVDGIQSGTIALTQKTYASYAELATEMQSRINGDSSIKAAGVSVGVTYDGAKMVFTSKSYGASSQLEITANTTTKQGLSVGAGTPGQDVGGTIGGLAATGKGRELTSTLGDANGLKLIISDNVIGAKDTIDFSRGLIERLDKVMSAVLDKKGSFDARTDGLQKGLDKIAKERAKLADRMTTLEARLFKRFNSMDALLGRMQSTASFLQQAYNPTPRN